ncbi:MAG: NAD(P)-binding protein, partial [Nanoarchaeota archaeon]|nr:NAD(P)-binding protein [Nanoarchaeota archaeon]
MVSKKVAIIGAGPAGLTAAYELCKKGFKIEIFEEDLIFVGGISRTVEYKGFRFDIGGHRFFSKNKEIEKWWEDILGNDFLVRPRLSRWYYRKKFFNYPIKPLELLKVFGIIDSIKIALSYARAKIKPINPEKSLADWCINNFGAHLAKPFFIDYNLKLWGVHPRELSKDFASQRVKGISFTSALR